ncbi:hypothetical protein L2E82_40786 [Cichorium intybus]|uniref:Uncharacterized protein n=1 Tax=Cichorium intybus TaxID=13427 RepID=A0ACB9AMW9_CICIN|nr:hypothetical protein L2E82_40786 [Cichorium intybus]
MEVKQMGIITGEPQGINEIVNIKINGLIHHIRVIENPLKSLNLAPKLSNHDRELSSEGDWLDMEHDQLDIIDGGEKESQYVGEMHETSKGVHHPRQKELTEVSGKKEVKVAEQIPREDEEPWPDNIRKDNEWGVEPNSEAQVGGRPALKIHSVSPVAVPLKDGPGGSGKGERGPTYIPDLNNSPNSTGFFPFIENVEDEVDDFDFGMEESIEQEIADEIEKKKRNRKKGGKKGRNQERKKSTKVSEEISSGGSKGSRGEEIKKTMEIGVELGVNWEGREDLVGQAFDAEGGNFFRC